MIRAWAAYPFGDTVGSRTWREPLESWFEDIGRAVFLDASYEQAVTGFEVSGVEPTEVHTGSLGLYRPTEQGTLAVDRVTKW